MTERKCSYCDRAASWKAIWTVYGGALRARVVCDYHAATVRGRRGVELQPLEGH